jgi:hypothetical protein
MGLAAQLGLMTPSNLKPLPPNSIDPWSEQPHRWYRLYPRRETAITPAIRDIRRDPARHREGNMLATRNLSHRRINWLGRD